MVAFAVHAPDRLGDDDGVLADRLDGVKPHHDFLSSLLG
jgi:hypothetical protein